MEKASSASVISVPKGGGAIKGIGETFAPDLQTGTGNFAVPIALPPGRNEFQPQLNLVYSSGNGNGPFGLGWNLNVPGVARRTSKGVPLYDDAKDVFILSGAEDLVPVQTVGTATRYRPRTEGLFAQVLYHRDSSNSYWEVRSKDGLLSFYGTPASLGSDPAVIANPADRLKAFSWRLTRTQDPFLNSIEYDYERDTAIQGPRHWDQLYLKQIRYGDYSDGGHTKFLVSVTFEYEDRPKDSFSEYRAGFEIRTRKRCTRIVIRTHAQLDRLVRSYELTYADQRSELPTPVPINGVSLLSTVTVTGHDGEEKQSLPGLELGYSAFDPRRRDFLPINGADLPARSLANADLELVDLFGQGLPDILEMNGVARYWRNLGGTFDLPRPMREAPGGLALENPGVQLIDADGDGRTDLLVTTASLSGYFPLLFGGLWDHRSFRRYRYAPSFNLEDPEVKLVDLDGDGVTDAIRSGARLECFFNHPLEGWHRTRQVERRALEDFQNINFSDPRVKWADMSGDGLQDIVLVHEGNVEYWPNLGHGEWGKRIHMEHSPRFPHGYDPRRILVGDVDGDGLADIVYVEDTKVSVWINVGGNGWSDPVQIVGTPRVSDVDSVRLADMLGNGVPGLLWSSDFGAHGRHHLFFLDFTGGRKAYLLNEIDNRIGAITRIEYAPSTRYFLEDQKKLETQWRTALPFPVQVVSCVEVIDELSRGKLTTEYRYHHGYWDGAEREFRGFGMVEQIDSESFERYDSDGLHGTEAFFARVDRKYFSPPTLTKTWFHQGPVGDEFGDWKELDWSGEYWLKDPPLLGHTQSVNQFLNTLSLTPDTRRVKRDALRALRGSILRSELYGLDGSLREDRPYTVTEYAYGLRGESAPDSAGDRQHIFFPHQIGQRTTQWERGNDPMTQFSFTGDFDDFGQPRRQIQIACPRGWRAMADRPVEAYLATRSLKSYGTPIDPSIYIHDRVTETVSHEVLQTAGKIVADVQRQAIAGIGLELIGHSLHFYDGAAFEGLPFGQVGRFGSLVRSETLAITDDQLQEAYGNNPPPYLTTAANPTWPAAYPAEFRTSLAPRAGYFLRSGAPYSPGFYIASDRRCYDFQQGIGEKGLVTITRDPLGNDTVVTYDTPYRLLPETVTDAVGLRTVAVQDYRLLQPTRVTDPNSNATEVAFTPLGFVKATFIRGKSGEGDQTHPSVVMEYDLHAFEQSSPESRKPIFVHTTRRIHHQTDTDVPLPERDALLESYEYSDGFGRLLQTRTQAEDLIYGDEIFGDSRLSMDQSLPPGDFIGRRSLAGDPPNVTVSGWQVFDNKGRVVEKFEPFFSAGWQFRSPQAESEQFGRNVFGNRISTFYDPRGQVVRTLNPDRSEQRVVFGVPGTIGAPDLSDPTVFEPTSWEAYTYDTNDNAGRTHAGVASSYAHHWNTPCSVRVDARGRTVDAVARNRASANDPIEEFRSRSSYDIRGNLLSITDALGRLAFRYVYDYANRRLRLESIDAGMRRTVLDAAGQVIEQADGKGAWILNGYDRLSRPSRLWARDDSTATPGLRVRMDYGDGGVPNQPAAERSAQQTANRLGKVYKQYDEAGLLTFEQYDFRGNVAEKVRQVISDQTILSVFASPPPDWRVPAFRIDWQPPAGITLDAYVNTRLDSVEYRTSAQYDALGRIKSFVYPKDVEGERKALVPHYNRAGALERVSLAGEIYVDHIAYNAKGQRTLIAYGNKVMSARAYDPQTFQLRRLWTGRYRKLAGSPPTFRPHATDRPLQDLAYEYDLVSNILTIADRTPGCGVLNTHQGQNALDRQFRYDAVYRLRRATGREGINIPAPRPWTDDQRNGFNSVNHGTANQDNAPQLTREYSEEYRYDPAGNLVSLRHDQNGNVWVRHFGMGGLTPQHWQQQWQGHFGSGAAWSDPPGNRLTHVGDDQTTFPQTHFFDDNGNLIRETSSRHLEWDHNDCLKAFRIQAGNSEPSVHAQYLYDAAGKRVKKLTRRQGGAFAVTIYIDKEFEHHFRSEGDLQRENNSLHVVDNRNRLALIRIGNAFSDDGSPSIVYHFGDHQCSSSLAVDHAGTWINREEYTPYGETSFGSFGRKRYRFTGPERDEESGLSCFGARYYASWLGRWASCDPAGAIDALNLYTYVLDNPIKLTDRSGLRSDADMPDYPPTPSARAYAAKDTNASASGPPNARPSITPKSDPSSNVDTMTPATPSRPHASLAGPAAMSTVSPAMRAAPTSPAKETTQGGDNRPAGDRPRSIPHKDPSWFVLFPFLSGVFGIFGIGVGVAGVVSGAGGAGAAGGSAAGGAAPAPSVVPPALPPPDFTRPSRHRSALHTPSGEPMRVTGDAENRRGLTRENETARTLSQLGFDVEQQPTPPPDSVKAPDLKIEGSYFDVYAPGDANLDQIWSKVEDKVSTRQALRIVVNLDDSPHTVNSVRQMFEQHRMVSLKELMLLRNGQITRVFLGSGTR